MKYSDHDVHLTKNAKLILRIGLPLTLLLGIWIGHLFTDGATHSSAPAPTLQISLSGSGSHSAFYYFGSRWVPVGPSLAAALAEGGAPNADSRVWEHCAVRVPSTRHGRMTLVCPDGYTEHWRI